MTAGNSQITVETVKTERVERRGVVAVYRLIRRDEGFAVAVECRGESEEVGCFPGGEADAERLYDLAAREFVLPGTLADVWRDLHTEG
jgi:hypothetical protein